MSASDGKPLEPSQKNEQYRCGSLLYSKAGLIALFGWMIWGKICFDLFEQHGGYTIMNLYLQDNFHASNLTVNLLFNVIPMIIGIVMTPIISFKSDRTRTRWGRRIPYILFTAPFLAVFAAAIGFSDDIMRYCKISFPETGTFNSYIVALGIIALLTIGYTFFNEFVGCVYYYLLPDVMPRHFIGRFQGVAAMVGQITGILTNLYVIPYQLTHIKYIHIGLAILYVLGLGSVCLFVKEPEYPPVEDVTEKTRFSDQVKLYFRECFFHPIFILFYLASAAAVLNKGLNPAGIFILHLADHEAKVVACAEAEAPATPPAPDAADIERVKSTVARMLAEEGLESQNIEVKPPALVRRTTDAKGELSQFLTLRGTYDGQYQFRPKGTQDKWQDGRMYLIAEYDRQEWSYEKVLEPLGTHYSPLCMAMTPDGRKVVTADWNGAVGAWDNTGKKPVLSRTTATQGGLIQSVAITANGETAICGSRDGTILVLDTASGQVVRRLTAHPGGVRSVAMSRDGKQLASGGADKTVKIWDLAGGTCLRTLTGHERPVNCVAFSSDGSRLVSGGADKKIIIWDIGSGRPLKILEGSPGPVYAACFAPALDSVPEVEETRGWAMRQLYNAGFFLRQVFTNESLYDIPVVQTSKLLAPDGWVLSGGRDGAKDSEYARVRIWDVAEGKQIHDLKGHKGAITSVAWKPDLRVILSSSADASMRLWKPWSISSTASDQSYKTFSGYTHGVTAMAAADAGPNMASASVDGTIHTWNIDRGISLAKGGLRGVFMSIVAFVLVYPLGVLIDRWNPIRVTIVCMLLLLPFHVLFYLFFYSYTFQLYAELIRWPLSTLTGMAGVPMAIMLYPKTKYGQMASAAALIRQAAAAIAGPLGAILMDYLTTRALDTDYFRYGYLFQGLSQALSLAALVGVYYYWKRMGGDNYVAPEAEHEKAPEPVTAG